MAQKDKVKELVGRSLDSYHTKALQQMDRIEKKNKEQNHKISILTNELDNDYLTKTEEGSVISLEHSKEGMVYLDELQGNTLVNYCTDGSKELTLNGDIDVEGTFVTTTEGVDNGLVDVICEGNTLVNLANIKNIYENTNLTSYYADGTICETSLLKLNTAYTLIIEKEFLDGHNMNYKDFELGLGDSINVTDAHPTMNNGSYSMGYNTDKYETKIVTVSFADFKGYKYLTIRPCRRSSAPVEGEVGKYKVKIVFLEGDWTNKEIPPYFEGMKSVGQDDENGHKIEILSKKEHLVWEQGTLANANGQPSENNTRIRTVDFFDGNNVSVVNYDDSKYYILYMGYDENKKYVYSSGWIKSSTCPKNYPYIKLVLKIDERTNFAPNDLKEDIHFDRNYNKKEILLNEPLRALPSGVKDKIVKIGGKWHVERNCGEITFDGSDDEKWSLSVRDNTIRFINNSKIFASASALSNICNRFISTDLAYDNDIEGFEVIGGGSPYFSCICINKSKLNSADILGFRNWLQQNPTAVVYELVTPIYEEIIDVELITYLNTTHISNNSAIPCNMKIQNSGYNTIIKPSTLYTVALDTNKNGTIGINLGGAKVTTTNNVATITTPATLTDDSLRIYGKGIKGSKVRILEGDKTNWIPSFFEGMQSSFEDKVQEDGTYKMEILSEGKNKLNGYNFARSIFNSVKNSVLDTENKTIRYNASDIYNVILKSIKFKENTRYTIILKGFNSNEAIQSTNIKVVYTDGSTQLCNNFTNGISEIVTNAGKTVSHLIGTWSTLTTTLYYDECGIFEGVNVPFEPYKYHNKIQFSSIEPLRGVGDVKDRFVFKDGKLMIERNCQVTILDGNNELWTYIQVHDAIYNNKMLFLIKDKTTSNFNPNINGDYHSDRLNRTNGFTEYYNEGFVLRKDKEIGLVIESHRFNNVYTTTKLREWLSKNPLTIVYQLTEPTYEEIPFELQKIILEGYENGTLFLDTNIPPTVTTTYAGETPIVKAARLNKTEVLNNTNDINDNIVPYLMDMDYRVVCLQLEGGIENVSMARLFGGTYEMLQRDILSNRYSKEEYKYRLDAYLSANKITHEEYIKLGDMLNE